MSDTFDHFNDAMDQAMEMGDIHPLDTDLGKDWRRDRTIVAADELLKLPADFDASIARAVAKIRGSIPAPYQRDGMRTTRPGWREPFPVKGSPPQNPPRATKKEKLMRTMYDNHEGVNGTLPICMMDDDHLRNTIRLNATRFADQRAAGMGIQNGPATSDPMVKSLVRQKAWSEREIEERTCNILRHIAPYILEAAVRGGVVAEEATSAMRLITMRDQIVPGNPIQIAYEELP